jgi:hypothetical protein
MKISCLIFDLAYLTNMKNGTWIGSWKILCPN